MSSKQMPRCDRATEHDGSLRAKLFRQYTHHFMPDCSYTIHVPTHTQMHARNRIQQSGVLTSVTNASKYNLRMKNEQKKTKTETFWKENVSVLSSLTRWIGLKSFQCDCSCCFITFFRSHLTSKPHSQSLSVTQEEQIYNYLQTAFSKDSWIERFTFTRYKSSSLCKLKYKMDFYCISASSKCSMF